MRKRKRCKRCITIVHNEFDYDKLAEAIVKANNQIRQEEKENEDKNRSEILQQRKEYLKIKDYDSEKNPLIKAIKRLINDFYVFIRLLFIPKNKLKLFCAIDGLVSMFTTFLIFIIRIILYVFFVTFILILFQGKEIGTFLLLAIGCFAFAQLFRIAQYEIDRIKDRNYILDLFVGLLSIASIVISVLLN